MKEKIAATASAITYAVTAGITYAQTPTPAPDIPVKQGGSLGDIVDFIRIVGGWLVFAAGALAVVFLVIGGIQYMASAGNAEKAAAAKKTIIYSLIGVAVIALSYFLVSVVLDLLNA
ncbi:hypothetical protein C4544_00210 [candidate division WS5 bacterium]|uniref:Uncharacterized protein n=1 Tax=candidate division WS5 bacterium TaxID=2093353 RepID=A0A419DGK2_9BACT|nr:MAG: hypothetical protein C4544_00210 [candidate division WS5 bacterium]